MNIVGEEKISKLKDEIARARSSKHKCSLLIDLAMELRNTDPGSSLIEAQRALDFAEELNFPLGKARSQFCMGLACFNLTDYENAFIHLGQSWQLFKDAGDLWGVSNAINNIGIIYLRLGEYAKALEHFSSSLEIKKESNDLFGTANVIISMAVIHRETGNLEESQSLLTESLKISGEQGFHALTGKAMTELGITLLKAGKLAEASEKFSTALALFEKQKHITGVTQCYLQLGKIESATGNTQAAIALFLQGQEMASMSGDKNLFTVFLLEIAGEKLKTGVIEEAIFLLLDAKKIAQKAQEKPLLTLIGQQLSTAYEAMGNLKDALLEYRSFIALKDEINFVETSTLLRNQQISNRVAVLERENRLLEAERMAAVHELSAQASLQEIRTLNAMMEGQERERKRIAADLHDRIGSALSAIKLHLNSFAITFDNAEQKQSAFEKVVAMFDDTVKEVRQVSHNLASGVLVKFGLVPALKDLCESIDSSGTIKVTLYTTGLTARLDQAMEASVYSIVQELISNIIRHAHANEINVYLNQQAEQLTLMVEDDGIGFDSSGTSDGIGLQNIRWRTTQLRGKAFFDSLPGKGCTVTIEIPKTPIL